MKKYALLIMLTLAGRYNFACTTFLLNKNGQLLFGRNYDWITGEGIINTNQRGLFKTAAIENDRAASWVSVNGSITFNQYGKEFPTGGMNEKGLVVEIMWLEGSIFPTPDDRPAIGSLQWLQYQLDNFSTVNEVLASDKKIRIGSKETPLHYLVADAAGNVASIEFIDGRMVAHNGAQMPVPVLTNNTYEKSISVAKQVLKTGELPGDNSLDRFVTACKMLTELNTTETTLPLTDYAFSILDKVSQGNFTKWSIVYDISNKKIHFKTADFKNVKSFSFAAFDFACSAAPKMFNMNQAARGDVTTHFILPDKKVKNAAAIKAIAESKEYVTISEAEKKIILEYEDAIKCKE